jgi:hypothetical protein
LSYLAVPDKREPRINLVLKERKKQEVGKPL